MILISAFKPFDGDPENATEILIEEAKRKNWPSVHFVTLPVSFELAWMTLKQAIDESGAKMVLAMGQAKTRSMISVERVALNWIDARIKDAGGVQPVDQPVQTLGPLALPARLPTRNLYQALTAAGIPAELSYYAGTYVCNALMYDLLYWAEQKGLQAGFVHFPLLLEQKQGMGIKLDTALRALEIMVDELRRG